MLSWVCKGVVVVYQKFVSPYKGYSCPYRLLYGDVSCSEAVAQIIEARGIVGGWRLIRQRFLHCKQAAIELAGRNGEGRQRADLDCGLGGCLDFGGAGGCLSGFGEAASAAKGGSSSGCSASIIELFGAFSRKSWRYQLTVIGLVLLSGLLIGYALHGSKIGSVEIRLTDPASEDRDRKLFSMENSELPDYQLIWEIDGQLHKSSVHLDRTARDWLRFEITNPFRIGELDSLEIVNRQLFGAKSLEKLTAPGSGTPPGKFEIRYIRNWDVF